MNSFPFMPLYWNDFLSDNKVRVMSSGELGAYVRLLGAAWQEAVPGTLPTDEDTLSRLAGVGTAHWRRISRRVLACFVLNEQKSRWEQKRMMREYAAVSDRTDRRSDAGSKAAAARWGKGAQINGAAVASPSHATVDANAMRPDCLSESDSYSESSLYRETPRAGEPAAGGLANETRMVETEMRPQCGTPPADAELLTEAQALAVAVTAGIEPDFAKMVHDDWSARGGRDGAGVPAPWPRYVAKRWAREGSDWKAGTHRNLPGNRSSPAFAQAGGAGRGKRDGYRNELERDRARTGLETTAGATLRFL